MTARELIFKGNQELNTVSDGKQHTKLIFEHVFGKPPIDFFDEDLNQDYVDKYLELIKRRKEGTPVQYILESWSFFGNDYIVGPGVLIPRSDTEAVVEEALNLLRERSEPVVFDLCSGTGCIGLTIADQIKSSEVYCIEKSEEAYSYLNRNRDRISPKTKIFNSDIFTFDFCPYNGTCDMVISNPPYVTDIEYQSLDPELYFEPKMALVAEDEGLYFYKRISKEMKSLLKPGGFLVFEVGYSQSDAVADIMEKIGYKGVVIKKDYYGASRTVIGTN